MKVTVCELNAGSGLKRDWNRLVAHVHAHGSELVLLPEMPFSPWFCAAPNYDARVWREAVEAHDMWMPHFSELAPAIVLGSRPIERDGQRRNEAFRWSEDAGYRAAHHKYFLPNEEGFWEANWYSRGDGSFDALQCGAALVGFEICTELWAMDQARRYGNAGVHIIATPRATPHSTLDKWVVGGCATAVCSGAYSISSNHVSTPVDTADLGGRGWIVSPDGELLTITSKEEPVVTADLDLDAAVTAKNTYPRYVF